MDVGVIFFLLSTWMVAYAEMNVYNWGKVVTAEYCVDETYRAQCSQDEVIVVQSAMYGHMSLGRCVELDTGHLGCQADVTDIVARRCNGKHTCEIDLLENEEIKNTQPCGKGLSLYMQATHMCTKALPSSSLCSEVKAQRSTQYISSSQIPSLQCLRGSDYYNYELPIKAQPGQTLQLTIINLDTLASGSQGSAGEVGYMLEGASDRVVPIVAGDRLESSVGVSKTDSISVHLSSESQDNFIIGFRAFGCANIKLHLDARVERNGDKATVVCNTSPQRWHLSCRGDQWIGVIGNCTSPTLRNEKTQVHAPKEQDLGLPKDLVIMIIVCATIFLAVIVVTVGCVCLKWPKKAAPPKLEFGTMARPLDTSADSSNTGTFKYMPESRQLLVAEPEQPIWEQSLPRPPTTDPATLRTTNKRNNEDVYNMGLSSTSTDCERKKYYTVDKDYVNANLGTGVA